MGKKNPWKSKVGRDCVSLDTALARWLGKRLVFLSTHSNGVPHAFMATRKVEDTEEAHDMWRREMRWAGDALTLYGMVYELDYSEAEGVTSNAHDAMQWVAEWFTGLWD